MSSMECKQSNINNETHKLCNVSSDINNMWSMDNNISDFGMIIQRSIFGPKKIMTDRYYIINCILNQQLYAVHMDPDMDTNNIEWNIYHNGIDSYTIKFDNISGDEKSVIDNVGIDNIQSLNSKSIILDLSIHGTNVNNISNDITYYSIIDDYKTVYRYTTHTKIPCYYIINKDKVSHICNDDIEFIKKHINNSPIINDLLSSLSKLEDHIFVDDDMMFIANDIIDIVKKYYMIQHGYCSIKNNEPFFEEILNINNDIVSKNMSDNNAITILCHINKIYSLYNSTIPHNLQKGYLFSKI